MRSTLAKSLLIDFLLTPIRLPHGDDAGCFAVRRMGNDDHPSSEHAQGDKPFLSIVEAAILEGNASFVKHLLGIFDVRPIVSSAAAVLALVPSVSHLFS